MTATIKVVGRRVSDEWTEEDRREVGARLRLIEQAAGVNGSQMAELLGMSRQRWSDYKRGKATLTIEEARKLKGRFGCSLDWLYIGDASNNTGAFQRKLDEIGRG